ncbi:protein kinase 4-like [Venturia canescens]|uniref:protein kinase 4-like n=1 Tax=Venturia canescens TaxID=32260 RepID=UPI001C9CD9A2|nr:protein kinase 4-like [Venturia canescens]XP_043267972.1 protein kinase 4-like [Venturia canescens]
MDHINNDFEELEPRATPQRTVLKCVTDPSVPEVSLIFGKEFQAPEILPENKIQPSEKCKAYINWKNSGCPSPIDQRSVAQRLVTSNHNFDQPLPNSASPHKNSNAYFRNEGLNYNSQPTSNYVPIQYKQNQTIALQKHGSSTSEDSNAFDKMYNSHQRALQDISLHARPRTELIETPIQNGSYNAIKSILKSSLSNNASGKKTTTDNSVKSDKDFHSRSPLQSSHNRCQNSPRQTDVSTYSYTPPVSRCQHSNELTNERDTVRDLLLLVKNQNEQIKTLQSQVERLLEIHENNIGHRSVGTRSNSKCQSSTTGHDIDAPMKNNVIVSAQKSCHSRGINAMSCYPGEEQPEVPLRFQNEPLRNTLVEKKVSIGVMTSFEFSVQNNPFVTDTDNQPSSAQKECAKNMSRSSDTWGPKVLCSRKMPIEPLENISEDTESHPSSIGRPSNNNTQISSPEKFISQSAANVNSNFVKGSSNSNNSQDRDKNSSIIFSNKPAACSSEMYDNHRSQKNAALELTNEQAQHFRNLAVRSSNKLPKNLKHAQTEKKELKDYNGTNELESNRDANLENERMNHQYSKLSKYDMKSIPAENTAEGSLILCSSDLEVRDRSPPSLDPSIHVEMREYSSDDEPEELNRAPPVGWTFYKNVFDQVNRILHAMPNGQDIQENEKTEACTYPSESIEKKDILSSVKTATIEQLKMLGISYAEHSQFNGEHTQKKVTFDSSYIPTVDCQVNVAHPSISTTETNTSMHMKTLALKYLSDEQLADLAVHQQGVGATMKQKFLSVQGTNMSFATMNYLQRYCLVSGMHTLNTDGNGQENVMNQKKPKHFSMPKEPVAQPPARNQSFENSMHRTVSDNILDMTTLKQQPKLL